MQLKLSDMATLGLIYLNNGFYKGIQFFGKKWVELSMTSHVELEGKKYPKSYGYFWRICNNGQFYKATGVFGQDTLIIPNENCVLAYQCKEGTDTSLLRDLLQKELFDKIS